MTELELTLPYPPSANKIWRYAGGKPRLSADAKLHRDLVAIEVVRAGNPRIEGRLGITLYVHSPDNQEMDLDNTLKATIDALEHARVFENDSQIDEIHVYRCEVAEGQVDVRLWQLEE